MNSWVQRMLRRFRSEHGFSVIETLIAFAVLLIVLVALGRVATSSLMHGLRNRERETAISLSNRTIEEIRSNGYSNVAQVDGPTTYTDSTGTFTTLRNTTCTTCLIHSRTVAENGFNFTVNTYVIGIDDSDDGTGAGDTDAVTVDYKRVVVHVISGTANGFDYSVETILHDTAEEDEVTVQGLSIEIHDVDTGALIDDESQWSLDVNGAGIGSAAVNEGIYNNFAIPPGTYTCTLNTTPSSEDWHPFGNQSATSETFACPVSAGAVNTILRTWEITDNCPAVVGQRSDLWIQVVDTNGTGLTGASVDPAQGDAQAENPAAANTTNGEVIFPSTLIGDYTLTVSKTGYVTQTGLLVCLTDTEATEPHLVVTMIANAPSGSEIQVTFKSKKKGTKNWMLALEDGTVYYEQQLSVSKDQTVTFIIKPVEYGTYDLVLYCQKKDSQVKWNKRKEDKDETFSLPTPPYVYNFGDVNC